jgi:malate/lactate dehydrogenase
MGQAGRTIIAEHDIRHSLNAFESLTTQRFRPHDPGSLPRRTTPTTLSLVGVLGSGGVQRMYEPPMSADERAALERSAATLRAAVERCLAIGMA